MTNLYAATLPAEEKAAVLARMDLDPDCKSCKEFYNAANPLLVHAPRHKASSRCESGKRPHCTCDTCF